MRATGRSRPGLGGRLPVCRKAVMARSISGFTTRASSGCWRAGRATCAPTRSCRFSVTAPRAWPTTARSRTCRGLPRSFAARTSTCGSTRVRRTRIGVRIVTSTRSWVATGSSMRSLSPRAATPGSRGVTTPRPRCRWLGCGLRMDRRIVRVAGRAAELLVAGLLALSVVVGAVGLLYLLRPRVTGWPGPILHEALPLDQLAAHDAVPLLAFVLVWLGAGLALGGLAMAARVERLTAGLFAGLVTGGVLYAVSGVSIFVVRQIQAGSAFRHALYVPAVYLASVFAGIGGAALGRRQGGASRRAPLILGAFVAVSGVLDVASAITPEIASRLSVIENATPNVVPRLASALVVPVGLVL